jgi:hypothetical protein
VSSWARAAASTPGLLRRAGLVFGIALSSRRWHDRGDLEFLGALGVPKPAVSIYLAVAYCVHKIRDEITGRHVTQPIGVPFFVVIVATRWTELPPLDECRTAQVDKVDNLRWVEAAILKPLQCPIVVEVI